MCYSRDACDKQAEGGLGQHGDADGNYDNVFPGDDNECTCIYSIAGSIYDP